MNCLNQSGSEMKKRKTPKTTAQRIAMFLRFCEHSEVCFRIECHDDFDTVQVFGAVKMDKNPNGRKIHFLYEAMKDILLPVLFGDVCNVCFSSPLEPHEQEGEPICLHCAIDGRSIGDTVRSVIVREG